MTAATVPSIHRQSTAGPNLAALAGISTALFLAGLIVGRAMGDATFPSPFDSSAVILRYFHDNRDAVRVSAFFQFGSAIPLALYAATASARLRNLGVRAPGATIALVGGTLAAAALSVSALVGWTLSQPGVLGSPSVVRALHDLAFATGGPGHVVPLGLLFLGLAIPALFTGLLPRWLAVGGLVLGVVAELSTLTLLVDGAAYLLPVARFLGLAWLIVVGVLLPTTRAAVTPG
ncbi:MAG: hypothetical protein JWL73_3952 [Actinomycetia bacterium]|nr:hypothetical protein [Actinomycetes bacterium]